MGTVWCVKEVEEERERKRGGGEEGRARGQESHAKKLREEDSRLSGGIEGLKEKNGDREG